MNENLPPNSENTKKVDFNPLIDVNTTNNTEIENQKQIQAARARTEREAKERKEREDAFRTSAELLNQITDTDYVDAKILKSIPKSQIGKQQKKEFDKLWLEGPERKAIFDAMGIDTGRGITYGPKLAEKVAKYQREKLGFTWENKEAMEAGRVPSGIIDLNTILAMSQLPDSTLDFGATISHFTTHMTELDKTQEKLCKQMGFSRQQLNAFFELMGGQFDVTTRSGMKLLVQEFQQVKLGFLSEDTFNSLADDRKEGKNVADGYFGPKTLAALKKKGGTLFPEDSNKQKAIAILLGSKEGREA